jgi:hypothetical protein
MKSFNTTAQTAGLRCRSSRIHWTMQAAMVLLLAGAAGASHAQFGGMGGGRRGGRSSDAAQGTPLAGRPTSRWEEASNRLYDVRLQLQLTAPQAPAWQDFRARFIDAAMAAASNPADAEEQSTATAFQRQLDAAQKRAGELGALNASAQALLASFSDDQRRTADRTLPALLDEFIVHGAGSAAGRPGVR